MSPGRNLLFAIAGIVVLAAGGTAGYIAIEHMSALDALYMTIITISTVGYEEVKPLDEGGRIFTMVLIVTGVGGAFYIFATVTQFVVEGQLREMVGRVAMKRKIEQLEGHIVICRVRQDGPCGRRGSEAQRRRCRGDRTRPGARS
jgi:voltage-gated potassium channel